MKVNIIRLHETDSTNRFLKEYTSDKEDEMTIAVAEFQTSGRGQGTHTWESESGKNLLFSIKVHPHWVPVRSQFVLAMAEALSLKDALDCYTDEISLKWPNDVYWRDKKISGTLIETNLGTQGLKTCIFGTGININQWNFCSGAPNPVSLCQILGHEIDRKEVLTKVVEAFEKYYELLRRADYMDVSALYHLALYRRKGYHRYQDKNGEFDGVFVEVEDDGHLILHDRQGMIRSYMFGELKFLPDAEMTD